MTYDDLLKKHRKGKPFTVKIDGKDHKHDPKKDSVTTLALRIKLAE